MTTYKVNSPEAADALRALEARRGESITAALRVADAIIAGVRGQGDAYAAEQIANFDRVTIAPGEIRIAPREVRIGDDIAAAIDLAIERVEAFHRPQLPQPYRWNGVAHRVRPLRRVACYVPGGRAVYLSTLIMTAVPARIAGVGEIVCLTTPAAAERDELHYVCNRLGIREIYRCGGAAGVAAAELGTATLRRVDKIVGPGNAYVTAENTRLVGEVGIDMTAGPTELVVIADETAEAAFVQADLDAQAEHGADSAVICVSIGQALDVRATLRLVADSVDEAVAMVDRIEPVLVSHPSGDAEAVAARLENCGAIFCGPFSPVAAGDYIAGPNHVLPTGGTARFFSPLGVYDFVKRSNVIALDAEQLTAIALHGERLATFEGLPKHAASLAIRRAACLAALSPR
jgi:histidinol dehydrogenase